MVVPVVASSMRATHGQSSNMARACMIACGLLTLVAINSFLEHDFLIQLKKNSPLPETVLNQLMVNLDQHRGGVATATTTTTATTREADNHPVVAEDLGVDSTERKPTLGSLRAFSTHPLHDQDDVVDDIDNDSDDDEKDFMNESGSADAGVDDDQPLEETKSFTTPTHGTSDSNDKKRSKQRAIVGQLSTEADWQPASHILKSQTQTKRNDPQDVGIDDNQENAISNESPLTDRHAISPKSNQENTTFISQKNSWTARANQNQASPPTTSASPETPQDKFPWRVVWLMSFPNSGTTYTLKFVQSATNTTTATNYGAVEQDCCNTTIPVDPSYTDGPYWRHPFNPTPNGTNLILTKTHCGADDPDVMAVDHDIEGHCRLSYKRVNGNSPVIFGHHSRELVAKAVHLIRNPFDNIVARMHYRQHVLWHSSEVSTQALGRTFNSTYTGFQSFCRWVDQHTVEQKKPQWNEQFPDVETWMHMLHPVPCFSEFVRWLRWHEQIVEMLDNVVTVPVLNLYYENYATDFPSTTAQLLDFLELKQSHNPVTFQVGKTYPEFYDPEQVVAIRKLIQTLATPKVWGMIRHYFD